MTGGGEKLGAAPDAPPGWMAEVVHHGNAPVAVFDAAGLVVYANPAMHDLLTWPQGSLLGTNAFDLVHPEDLHRAATAVTSVGDGARPRPGQIQLRRGNGAWALLEINPSSLDLPEAPDGPGSLTAITIRDNWLQDAHWRFLTALTAGEPLHPSLDGLAVALSHHPDGPMAVVYDDAGRRRVAGPLAPELAGVRSDGEVDLTPGTPWAEAMDTEQPAWCAVTDLPEPFRALGVEVGAACVAVPVPDPASGRPALLVQWPPDVAMAEILSEALVRRPRQAVMLALQRRDTFDRLERLALQDPLTQLANRTHFFAVLEQLASSGRSYGVCYVDLDRFKAVNDSLGHLVGDKVLAACARRLEAAVRVGDVVARLGGDEFTVACPVVGAFELEALANRIVAALAVPVPAEGRQLVVGATVGCAIGGSDDVADEVVARADAALYRAKRAARGTWSRSTDHPGGPA